MPQEQRTILEVADRDEYLHKVVWRVVERQLEHAKAQPNGALYDNLVAMVFTFHALEGYLNFLGSKIAQERWRNEREEFSGSGIVTKLNVLHSACGLPVVDKSTRPYFDIRALEKLRNRIAHPKTCSSRNKITRYKAGHEPPLFAPTSLELLVSAEKAQRAARVVEAVADTLHAAATRQFPDQRLGESAFGGILSTRSTSWRLLE